MFYITTSRPYTNATPHLGTAIDVIYADCFNRFFKRLHGHTFWSMGTDEHSFKIVDKARELGVKPQTFVNEKYQEFQSIFDQIGVVADGFLQSSSPKHKWLANLVFEKLRAKDLIYKKSYEGLYCTGCEDFWVMSQLTDGKCPTHPNLQIQKVAEENYFFRLTSFREKLLAYLGGQNSLEKQKKAKIYPIPNENENSHNQFQEIKKNPQIQTELPNKTKKSLLKNEENAENLEKLTDSQNQEHLSKNNFNNNLKTENQNSEFKSQNQQKIDYNLTNSSDHKIFEIKIDPKLNNLKTENKSVEQTKLSQKSELEKAEKPNIEIPPKNHFHSVNCQHNHESNQENLEENLEHKHAEQSDNFQVLVPDESVLVEMRNFATDLQDISISRQKSRISTDWGVPISTDPEHLMYVWFEALITYLTPLIPDEIWQNYLESEPEIQKVCEAEVWTLLEDNLPQNLQIIGRDNAKFHLIIWPAILFGLDLCPIETCLVHGMITDNLGRKFAKSLGNGVNLDEFVNKVGMDGVRFFILHDCNSVGDTSFDWTRVIESHNANLANNLGNLVCRITNLIAQYLEGFLDLDKFETDNFEIIKNSQKIDWKNYSKIPQKNYPKENLKNEKLGQTKLELESELKNPKPNSDKKINLEKSKENVILANLTFSSKNLEANLVSFTNVYKHLYDLQPELAFRELIKETTKINQFLELTKPWTLAKDLEKNKPQIEQILTLSAWNLLEIAKVLSIFLPESGAKIVEILTQVKITKAEVLFARLEL